MHSQETPEYDLLIIGAGAAGLTAAYTLMDTRLKIALVEARDRTGGRIHTAGHPGFPGPLERGAEFIHGHLEETARLLKEAGLSSRPVSGSIWQKEEGGLKEQDDFLEDPDALQEKFRLLEEDATVQAFMDRHLEGDRYTGLRRTLTNYIEGYYAADADRASMQALMEEWTEADEEQFRVGGGYGALVRYLEQQCAAKGCAFYRNTPVRHIRWEKDHCTAEAEGAQLTARKVLITIPAGVLTAPPSSPAHLRFTPELEAVRQAYGKLGFGPVIKFLLLFREAFWLHPELAAGARLNDPLFFFSDEAVPTWWTQQPSPSPLLTGWLAGPKAERLKEKSTEELLSLALLSLSSLFSVPETFLRGQLLFGDVANWATDPYSLGAYSYHTVEGAAAMKELTEPIIDTLFFAGEALQPGPQIGTVEAAIRSGKEAAARILGSLQGQAYL